MRLMVIAGVIAATHPFFLLNSTLNSDSLDESPFSKMVFADDMR